MRAGAQVGEFTLAVERDNRVLRQVVDEFDLIRLIFFLHEGNGLFTRQLKAFKLQLFLADLAHLGLELVEHLLGEVERRVKVVVKAVVDGRADGQLHLGMQALDRLRQNVRAGVPIRLAVAFIFKRIQVFFRHEYCSLRLIRGKEKTLHP